VIRNGPHRDSKLLQKFQTSLMPSPIAEVADFKSRSRPFAPTRSAAARVIPSVTPVALAAYDVALCDRACPFCDKMFNTGKSETSRKSLAKHVNDHSPDPTNARFMAWLEATKRAWCSECQFSYARRQTHHCGGPRTVASVVSGSEAVRVASAADVLKPMWVTSQLRTTSGAQRACFLRWRTFSPLRSHSEENPPKVSCNIVEGIHHADEALLHFWVG
jgi:hypothetical protein